MIPHPFSKSFQFNEFPRTLDDTKFLLWIYLVTTYNSQPYVILKAHQH